MKYRLFKLAIYSVACACSMSVNATPENIQEHPHYLENTKLLKKLGREKAINSLVQMQRDQVREYGASVDEYTEAISVSGDRFGMTQSTMYKIDSMLKDLNTQRLSEGKKPIERTKERAKFIEAWQQGGAASNAQINMLCSNPSSRALIDNNIDYVMKYYDERMTFISGLTIDHSACLKNDKENLTRY